MNMLKRDSFILPGFVRERISLKVKADCTVIIFLLLKSLELKLGCNIILIGSHKEKVPYVFVFLFCAINSCSIFFHEEL